MALKLLPLSFPKGAQDFEQLKDLVNQTLSGILENSKDLPQILRDAIRHVVLSNGHRWRPLLTFAVYQTFKKKSLDPILPVACSVELVHNATIMLDDLPCMDDGQFRRGIPACHKVFGEDMTILGSLFLIAKAFQIISEATFVHPSVRSQLTMELGSCLMRMTQGQTLDLKLKNNSIRFKELEKIYEDKSSRLYVFSIRAGAFLAGADKPSLKALTNYGRHLGIAYQILDDVYDAEGPFSVQGKDVRKDTFSLRSVYGNAARAKKIATKYGEQALKHMHSLKQDTKALERLTEKILEQ